MNLFGNTFYDNYGIFDNTKFVDLLNKARKLEIKARRGGNYKGRNDIILFNIISKKDIWSFINKLSIFINSGIDIKTALSISIKQTKNPELKDIIIEMKLNIDHGVTIAETMQQHPKVFDQLVTALVGVGEKTGQLGRILSELDRNLLDSIELKSKVKGALIYPIILLTLTTGVVIFMMIFIVPKISDTFEKANVDLPKLTQAIVNTSNFFVNDYLWLIIIILSIIIGIKFFKKTNTGRMFFSYSAINMPIFGKIVKQSNVIYFINSFTILLDSGILLLESLKVASDVVPNLIYKKEVIRIKNEVELGLTISKSLGLNIDYEESLYLNKLFSEEFAYVVNTGEETGTLSVSLKRIGYNYDVELKRIISNLSSMLEPIIIVLIGAIVGTIVVGVMLPFFELGKVAQKM